MPATLGEGAERCLVGLGNGPHAVSMKASRTNGMTLKGFLTQAFMTIPSSTKGLAARRFSYTAHSAPFVHLLRP